MSSCRQKHRHHRPLVHILPNSSLTAKPRSSSSPSLAAAGPHHAPQRHARAVHDVDQPAGRGDQELAAALELAQLLLLRRAAVDHHGAHARLVRELARLVINLCF